MKTNIKQTVLILSVMILVFLSVKVASSQTLTIHPMILLNDESTLETVKVTIIDLNTKDTITNQRIIKGFTYKLEDKKDYLIVFQKEGFQSKSVAVSTNYTSNQKHMYTFYVNLSDENVLPDVKYAGGIYYNKKKKEFDYYLSSYVEH